MTLLGIDIGGTAVKMGLVTTEGQLLRQATYPVDYDGYRTPILHTVMQRTKDFLAETGETPQGIGISAAGQIDTKDGIVAGTCGNLPGWEGTPLKQPFAEAFGVPVTVMNDANCALLGEGWQGGAQGVTDVIMVTLGTGVGGGVLAGGRLLTGRRGLAGELGHMIVFGDGRPCTCGNQGCWEQYASVTALLGQARSALHAPDMDGRAFFAAAADDHAEAKRLLADWTEAIATGLVGLVHLFNPALLLIGGGVSAQDALLIAPLRARVLRRVMPCYREGLRLEAARLGNAAGIVGAVRYWLDTGG